MTKNKKFVVIILFLLIESFCLQYFSNNNEELVPKEENKTVDWNFVVKQVDDKTIDNYRKDYNNQDIIGELVIANSNFKEIVVQTNDNEFYLDHSVDKTYNRLGSIFMDYRNMVDDRKIIIYGHNSEDIYTEFNLLENYLNFDYYREHQDIYFKTINNNYHYKVFSVFIVINDYRYINLNFSDDEYNKHLKYLKEQSVYDTYIDVNDNDEIIVLQTCYFQPKNSYLVVVGKKLIDD